MAIYAEKLTSAYFSVAVVAIFCFLNAEGCFIIDCPNSILWNGKRGPQEKDGVRSDVPGPVRKCPPCGPRMRGQCFSATMCCTPELGCIDGENHLTEPCRQESSVPLECASAGPACMRLDRQHAGERILGVCAADGLCCNADGCSFHQACQLAKKDPESIVPTNDVVFQSLIGDLVAKMKARSSVTSRRRLFAGAPHILQALREYRRSQAHSKEEPQDEQIINPEDMY